MQIRVQLMAEQQKLFDKILQRNRKHLEQWLARADLQAPVGPIL
jgi:hypothetical protein